MVSQLFYSAKNKPLKYIHVANNKVSELLLLLYRRSIAN